MHCQSCGEKLRSRARFCNRCGKSVAERFGSALLSSVNTAPPAVSDTPTENLSPKARTAPNQAAPSTLENQAMASTDQLGLRGTGRQSVPKNTSEDVVPKLLPAEARTTVVDAKAFKELAPTRPASAEGLPEKLIAPTVTEAPAFVPPPPVAALVAPPKIAPSASPPAQNSSIEYLTPSTVELQRDISNKPFFTRMLTPNAQNPQHKYLLYAVPLVLLAALIVLIAFLWLR